MDQNNNHNFIGSCSCSGGICSGRRQNVAAAELRSGNGRGSGRSAAVAQQRLACSSIMEWGGGIWGYEDSDKTTIK